MTSLVTDAALERVVFATSRASDFLQRDELQRQTGMPLCRFGDVVVKELIDNALDAAEQAGVTPTSRCSASGCRPQMTTPDSEGSQ